MEKDKKEKLVSGMFANATFTNSVVVGVAETGSTVYYNKGGENKKPTDEQLAKAIAAINGKDKVLKNYQDWLGVCCLLSSKYDFPMKLDDCVEQINSLPFKEGELSVECRFDNIRRFGNNRFVTLDVEKWKNYDPNPSEETIFRKSFTIVRALENSIEKQLKED